MDNRRATSLARRWWPSLAILGLLCLSSAGCGSFMAHRLVQAPNTYPDWLAPEAPVLFEFSAGLLTNFPGRFLDAGPPPAKLWYRLVPPGNYQVKTSSTNWTEGKRTRFKFTFRTTLPKEHTSTHPPLGTVVLLHGYGLDLATMAPWALRLAEDGWRCVLVDLRGHGKSTGKRIFFSLREAEDMRELLDELNRRGDLAQPVIAFGESYGAAVALRWKTMDPRVKAVVAIAPYAELNSAALNLRRDYAPCFPKACLEAGLNKLPELLGVAPSELNPSTWLTRSPVKALFVVGGDDAITPVPDVKRLSALALPGSALVVVPRGSHEATAFMFSDLEAPVTAWLKAQVQTQQNNDAP
jgi:pimeloyl-ACP methyl ester carboxylesterase